MKQVARIIKIRLLTNKKCYVGCYMYYDSCDRSENCSSFAKQFLSYLGNGAR